MYVFNSEINVWIKKFKLKSGKSLKIINTPDAFIGYYGTLCLDPYIYTTLITLNKLN